MAIPKALVVNGWTLFAHPLFLHQLNHLTNKVNEFRRKDPDNYTQKNATKRLTAIHKLASIIIPKDPTLSEYRQGKTLGEQHKHWFRAKFFQQYRLFFRFHSKSKIIVYVWVNDEHSKRAYGNKNDAYRVFANMLRKGHPPDDWDKLISEVQSESLGFPSNESRLKL